MMGGHSRQVPDLLMEEELKSRLVITGSIVNVALHRSTSYNEEIARVI